MSTTKAIRYLTCFEYRISCTVRWTCAETLFVHFAWATNISCPPILRMRPVRVFSVINRKRKLFIDFSTFDKRRNFCVLSFIFFLFFHFSTNIFFLVGIIFKFLLLSGEYKMRKDYLRMLCLTLAHAPINSRHSINWFRPIDYDRETLELKRKRNKKKKQPWKTGTRQRQRSENRKWS